MLEDKEPLDMSGGSFSNQYLLVSGNKVTPCSADSLMSKEKRLRYVNDVTVTSKIVDQSKLSPYHLLILKVLINSLNLP